MSGSKDKRPKKDEPPEDKVIQRYDPVQERMDEKTAKWRREQPPNKCPNCGRPLYISFTVRECIHCGYSNGPGSDHDK